ncbi:MAG: hypothetical protein IJ002_03890 [Clostridia bacterium]|nr:hypothetical protein [Clostridia bacterium]
MKKIVAFLLTAAMLLSMTACGGGKDNTPPDNTDKPANTGTTTPTPGTTPSGTGEKEDEGGDSIVLFYGSNHYGGYEATFYCPEGAYIDEDDLEEYKADGSVMSFTVYDDVREYQAYAENHWSREIYTSDPEVYEIAPQLYFYGELDEINAEEYENCSQTVTDLGFQWEGKDVMLLETRYTFSDYPEQTELFVCVEFENEYWRTKDGGGTEEHLFAPALVGFELSGWADLTVDRCAWIAGQLFGVDSGRTWPLDGEGETAETPVVNVDAAELLGTWLQRDSDWDDTFIFNADGTGVVISGPEYPFTYVVNGDILTLTYDDGDQEEFTISVDGDLLTMIDQFNNELLLDKQAEEEPKPEIEDPEEPEDELSNPYITEILGTWDVQDSDYLEIFTFNEDGTGLYSYTDGEVYEFAFTYSFYNGDYVEIIYDDGTEDGFTIRIEGDTMYVSNLSVVDMPLVRQ